LFKVGCTSAGLDCERVSADGDNRSKVDKAESVPTGIVWADRVIDGLPLLTEAFATELIDPAIAT